MDALGMPRLRIDWRIGELERRSVMRLNELVGAELRRVGLPEYVPNKHLSEDIDWRSQFIDRAHPSGDDSNVKVSETRSCRPQLQGSRGRGSLHRGKQRVSHRGSR